MNARKVEVSFRNLQRALDRLGEALEVPESNTLAIDGTIQMNIKKWTGLIRTFSTA